MILNHVPCRTNFSVGTGTATNANVLGHRNLNMVNVVAVPNWLKQLVCKAKGQYILNSFLAQVVINPENRVRWKNALDDVV